LLAVQERIGLERNEAFVGREVEVLVDSVTEPGAHAHAEGALGVGGAPALSGRTRSNKLVHLAGDPALVGRPVTVRVEHAGPYSLRGALVGA
jgi:tRNA-2-methylthio-N6-dimethylallyladenosine synthase